MNKKSVWQDPRIVDVLHKLKELDRPISFKEIIECLDSVVGSGLNIECTVEFCKQSSGFHIIPTSKQN